MEAAATRAAQATWTTEKNNAAHIVMKKPRRSSRLSSSSSSSSTSKTNKKKRAVKTSLSSSTSPPSKSLLLDEAFSKTDSRPVILFDGVCNLCHGGVNFVLDTDNTLDGALRFAALQSDVGKVLLERAGKKPDDISSLVLVECE